MLYYVVTVENFLTRVFSYAKLHTGFGEVSCRDPVIYEKAFPLALLYGYPEFLSYLLDS